ncbi:hypothetical protein NDU88_000552 [Pleurodeles waltl]|uniref:Uncharacterized protein n=1 Tax=Pleurodeles waltl TaxID=8319 RepID=A0AAV7L6W1_PLEWA|nr:hypothetical protein NDU88_000552 [Pleurodeles waltl]
MGAERAAPLLLHLGALLQGEPTPAPTPVPAVLSSDPGAEERSNKQPTHSSQSIAGRQTAEPADKGNELNTRTLVANVRPGPTPPLKRLGAPTRAKNREGPTDAVGAPPHAVVGGCTTVWHLGTL